MVSLAEPRWRNAGPFRQPSGNVHRSLEEGDEWPASDDLGVICDVRPRVPPFRR